MLAEASPPLRKPSYVKTSRTRVVPWAGLRPYDSDDPDAPYALSPRSFRELVEYARFADAVGSPIVDALPPTGVSSPGVAVRNPPQRVTTAAVTVKVPRQRVSTDAEDDDEEEDPDDLRALVVRLWRAGAPEDLIANICATLQRRGGTTAAAASASAASRVFSAAQMARMAPYMGSSGKPPPAPAHGYYQQHTRTLYETYGPHAQRRSPVHGGGEDWAAAERRALLPLYNRDVRAVANQYQFRQDYGSVGPSQSHLSTSSSSFTRSTSRQQRQPATRHGNNININRSGSNGGDKRSALARGLRGALERCGGVFRFSAWLWSATAARLSWGRVFCATFCVLLGLGIGWSVYRGYQWVRGVVGALFGVVGY